MEVVTSHHIDASDQDDRGMYEYYYEYDLFGFTDGETSHDLDKRQQNAC
jgi:hypothetical protein